jgi:NifU-like protein involved in Fe-S cluster formation
MYKKKLNNSSCSIGPIKTSCGEWVTLEIYKENNIIIDCGFNTEGSQLIHKTMEHACRMLMHNNISKNSFIETFFNTFDLIVTGTRKETINSLLQKIIILL